MNNSSTNANAAILFLGIVLAANAREPKETDFWGMERPFRYEKNSANSIGLFGEFYTNDNSRSIDRMSIGVKGDLSFTHWLKAGAGYALMNFIHPGYNELRDRIYVQAEPFWHLSKIHF